jgi:hypothetical protein
MKYRTPAERAAANKVASEMTAGQFVDHWTAKWNGEVPGAANAGGAQAGTPGAAFAPDTYPNLADAMKAHLSDYEDQFTEVAQKNFPDDPSRQYSFVQKGMTGVRKYITQQENMYEVNADKLRVIVDANPGMTSLDQLANSSPEAQELLSQASKFSPTVLESIRRGLEQNANRRPLTYGSDIKDYVDRATAPPGAGAERYSSSEKAPTSTAAGRPDRRTCSIPPAEAALCGGRGIGGFGGGLDGVA